jgi:hypothetical protein
VSVVDKATQTAASAADRRDGIRVLGARELNLSWDGGLGRPLWETGSGEPHRGNADAWQTIRSGERATQMTRPISSSRL